MKWLKENGLTAGLTICVIFAVGLFISSLFDQEEYSVVRVKGGDTLWSLAETYRGDMRLDEWIAKVRQENHIIDDRIGAGEQLTIPLAKNHTNLEVASNK